MTIIGTKEFRSGLIAYKNVRFDIGIGKNMAA
jgi:hypothetical protein